MEHYVYKTFHTDFLKRRREWFDKYGKAQVAMWWVPTGVYPTIEEAVERLGYLQKNGDTPKAFSIKNTFQAPEK